MAITTNDAIYKHGTNTEVISTSGTVSDGAFSAKGDATTFTNSDDAPLAQFVFDGSMSGTPGSGRVIDLFAQLLGASGGQPTSNPSPAHEAIYLGSFLVDGAAPSTITALGPVGLPSLQAGQQYDFFIKNDTGVTISAGATVDIIPLTYGPAA